MYFPIGLVFTFCFIILDSFLATFSYFMHIINLVNTIANADETMDELSEKI